MVWLIAISHPKKEVYASQQLQNQGCECFVPMCWRDVPNKGEFKHTVSPQQKQQLVPLLSNYFLFNPNGLAIRTVLSTRGIRGLVKQAGGEPSAVNDREYQRWYEMTSMVADFRKKAAQYVIGQQLKIEEGPFAGMMGNLLEISGGKLKIDVDLMGRSVNLVVGKDAVKSIAA